MKHAVKQSGTTIASQQQQQAAKSSSWQHIDYSAYIDTPVAV
jgi:hypothetical protein